MASDQRSRKTCSVFPNIQTHVPPMELEPHPLTCSLHFGLISIPKAAPLAYAEQEEPWSFQERSVAFLQGHKAAGRMFGFACLRDGDEVLV